MAGINNIGPMSGAEVIKGIQDGSIKPETKGLKDVVIPVGEESKDSEKVNVDINLNDLHGIVQEAKKDKTEETKELANKVLDFIKKGGLAGFLHGKIDKDNDGVAVDDIVTFLKEHSLSTILNEKIDKDQDGQIIDEVINMLTISGLDLAVMLGNKIKDNVQGDEPQ